MSDIEENKAETIDQLTLVDFLEFCLDKISAASGKLQQSSVQPCRFLKRYQSMWNIFRL